MMTNKIDSLRNFYRGIWYPIFVAALVFTGHATGWDIQFASLVLLTAVPGIWIMHDSNFLFAPFCMLTLTVTARYYDFETADNHYDRFLQQPWFTLFLASAGIALLSIIVFMTRNRRSVNHLKQPWIFLSLLILCGVMLFNGAFNPLYTPKNLMYASFFSMATLFVYLLFALYGNFDRYCTDQFFFCLTVTGVLILLELLFAYFTRVTFADGSIVKESVMVGWGAWTHIGGMLAFLMPAPFYFARQRRNGWGFYLIGVAIFLGTLFSQSRGALLVGGVVFLLCLILVCSGGPNRKQNRVFTAILAAFLMVGALLLSSRLGALIQNFINYGFDDNGRFDLWKAGWAHFLDYPVFGSGFYDACVYDWQMVVLPYLYHDTLVQMLAACGAVGLLAYLWHRVLTVRMVFRNRSIPKFFFGVCLLGLLLFSLIDVLFFKIYSTMIYAMILVQMEQAPLKEQ